MTRSSTAECAGMLNGSSYRTEQHRCRAAEMSASFEAAALQPERLALFWHARYALFGAECSLTVWSLSQYNRPHYQCHDRRLTARQIRAFRPLPMNAALFGMAALLVVPGPTNAVLAAAGARLGLAGARGFVLSAAVGYACSILGWVTLLRFAESAYPVTLTVVRIISIVYLLMMAWRMASRSSNAASPPISWAHALTITFTNPKSFLIASLYLSRPTSSSDGVITVASLLGAYAVGAYIWTWSGDRFARSSNRNFANATIQVLASLVLVLFAVSVAWQSITALYERPADAASPVAAHTKYVLQDKATTTLPR